MACNSFLQENPNARGNGGSRARVSRRQTPSLARPTRRAHHALAPNAFGVDFWGAQAASLFISAACRDACATRTNVCSMLPASCRQLQAGSLCSPPLLQLKEAPEIEGRLREMFE